MKSIFVAYDKNYGIGAHNDLPWRRNLPADQRRFKEMTMGQAVIMGKKTYDSIGRLLPGRQNIIISRQGLTIEGAVVVSSLEAAFASVDIDKEAFVIGGGQIYKLAIDIVDQIIATEVDASFDTADVFFPAINKNIWQEISRVHHQADEYNKYDYDFVIYKRR